MWGSTFEQDLEDLSAEYQKSFESLPELLKNHMPVPMWEMMTPPRKPLKNPPFLEVPELEMPLTPLRRFSHMAPTWLKTQLEQPKALHRACKKGSCALLQCLQTSMDSPDHGEEAIQRCLASDPEAINEFFFASDFEPVLCCAVRSGCAPKIIELLLKHGAEVDTFDTCGYSPLTCLAALPALHLKGSEREATYAVTLDAKLAEVLTDARNIEEMERVRDSKEVARLLIDAGARPHEKDSGLRSAVEVATASGNTELAGFLEHYLEIKAGRMLVQAMSGPSAFEGLCTDELKTVLGYLLPSELAQQVWAQDSKRTGTEEGCSAYGN